jgi:N-acetylglutamate synthase-like GNAT family acetyltransferase
MTFTIRQANADEEQAIKALVRSANINPMGLHWQRFLVAEDAGRLIGIGQIKVHGDGSRELASIATVPDRQGEGIATAIIEALLANEASAPGPLYLTCRSHMEPFYQRFGFGKVERVADMPVYFRRLMRIASVMFAIGRLFGNQGGLVMVREGM